MSDLRIAMITEGPTDKIVLDSALNAFLDGNFVSKVLQPEQSDSLSGFGNLKGWGGVFQYCRQLSEMGPLGWGFLDKFDLIIFHLDADVAEKSYSDYPHINYPHTDLPCVQPCPPVMDTITSLYAVISGWLNLDSLDSVPSHWVFCIPSKSIEAWIIAGLYFKDYPNIETLECNSKLGSWLSQRPIRTNSRLKKNKKAYETIANDLTDHWANIEKYCTEALRFKKNVLKITKNNGRGT